MLTMSAWEENNKAFHAAIAQDDDFFLNVMLKQYARRGLPNGALENLRRAHPKESDRQLRARYLCPYKLELGSKTATRMGNWYRSQDMQDAAAAAVGMEEAIAVESVAVESVTSPFLETVMSVKCLRKIVIQNHVAAKGLDLESVMTKNLEMEQQDTSKDAARLIKQQQVMEEESAAYVDAMIERAQMQRAEREREAEEAKLAAEVRRCNEAAAAAVLAAERAAERAAAERKREQEERAAAAKKKQEAKKLKKLKEEEEDALLEAECAKAQQREQESKDKIAAEELYQDLINPRPFIPCKQEGCAKLPLKMALVTFVLCCSMRNHLFLNCLARFSAWSAAALLPPYEVFVHLFTATPKDSGTSYQGSATKTSAAQAAVQVMRNLVSVLELDSILSAEDSTGADYQLLYGLLYRSCERREGSLSLLSVMTTLGVSKELLDLYEAVSMLENFVSGTDFILFRQAFPLPDLPGAPEWTPKSRSDVNPVDEILSAGLLPHASKAIMIKTPSAAWSKYFLACKVPLNLMRSMWTANKTQINRWSCGIEPLPTAQELNDSGRFKQLLPLWFGTTYQQHPLFPNIKMHDTWKLIEACGLSMGVEDSKSQPLMYLTFLLSAPQQHPYRSALQEFEATCPPFPRTDFPFSTTIFQVRGILCARYFSYAHLTYTLSHSFQFTQRWDLLCKYKSSVHEKIARNIKLLDLAKSLGLN